MPWLAPSAADVLSEFTPQESASLRNAQGSDNLAAILARVVAEMRDYIRGGGYDLAADAATIPLGLHNDAISIARWRLLISVPSLKALQTDARKEACTAALAKLKDIAAQKFSVEPPADAVSLKTGSWNAENKIIGRMHPVPRPATQYPNIPPPGYANPEAPEDL